MMSGFTKNHDPSSASRGSVVDCFFLWAASRTPPNSTPAGQQAHQEILHAYQQTCTDLNKDIFRWFNLFGKADNVLKTKPNP